MNKQFVYYMITGVWSELQPQGVENNRHYTMLQTDSVFLSPRLSDAQIVFDIM